MSADLQKADFLSTEARPRALPLGEEVHGVLLQREWNAETHTRYAGPARLSVSNYLIVEAQLVRHLARAHLQLVIAQAHRAQERVPARIILKIR